MELACFPPSRRGVTGGDYRRASGGAHIFVPADVNGFNFAVRVIEAERQG